MPEQTFTRFNGYQPTGSEVNLGDRIFNGSAQLGFLDKLPYGQLHAGVSAVSEFLHYLGKQGLFGKPYQGPTSTMGPTQVGGMVGGAAPTDAGAFAGDPTDPNNPGAYSLGGDAAGTNSGKMDLAGLLSMWNGRSPNDFYNMNRAAGSATAQQRMFPGSAIGPWGGGSSNPYSGAGFGYQTRGDQGLGIPNRSMGDTGVSGIGVADAMAEVRKRHQI